MSGRKPTRLAQLLEPVRTVAPQARLAGLPSPDNLPDVPVCTL
jgi:hypothetical protein